MRRLVTSQGACAVLVVPLTASAQLSLPAEVQFETTIRALPTPLRAGTTAAGYAGDGLTTLRDGSAPLIPRATIHGREEFTVPTTTSPQSRS